MTKNEKLYEMAKLAAKQQVAEKDRKLSREIANMFKQHSYGKLWLYGDSK